MQTYFYELADFIGKQIPELGFMAWLSAEDTDFVRVNQGKIRQAGEVHQAYLTLDIASGQKHIEHRLALSGDASKDQNILQEVTKKARYILPKLEPDPYFQAPTQGESSSLLEPCLLPPTSETVAHILQQSFGLDVVGIYAQGTLHRGYANHLGQRNWMTRHSMNWDYSIYLNTDKAIKLTTAGAQWNPTQFATQLDGARRQLEILKVPSKTIPKGHYRAFLSPGALHEILGLLSGDAFSEKALRTHYSPLGQLYGKTRSLNPCIHLHENTLDGVAANFQSQGRIKPPRLALIANGRAASSLVSDRSALEYALSANGANANEVPESLDMQGGDLKMQDVLSALDTGLYINNLWYLNYSDRPNARVTGMTRFATFWVERGKMVAPLDVMRFDDSCYRMLGDGLLSLTAEREFILDPQTYEERSLHSARLPGALLEDLNLTL